MADQPSPRRRFQFRLRTLMIVVALLAVPCAYVAHMAKIVRERQALIEPRVDIPLSAVTVDETKDGAIPTVRRWLGDHFCARIWVLNSADVDRYKAAFPEADVFPPSAPPAAQ